MLLSAIRSWCFDRYRRLETREHTLRYLFLEITRRCNLSCRHCGSDCKHDEAAKALTTESWLKIISDIHDNFGRDVCMVLTGGEPLMHPDLGRITAHLASLAMPWGMVTNDHLLTDDALAQLQADRINAITVSLDGPQASHDHLRNQPGSFGKVVAALGRVARSEIPLRDVVTCVHPGNLDALDETAEILLEVGIPAWRLFRIFPSGRAARDPALNLTFEQTGRMLQWLEDNRSRLKSRGLAVGASCEGYLPFARDRKVRDTPFFCRAGVNFGSILTDGTVTGCSNNDPTFAQGNVLEHNFRYLWETRFEAFRDRRWLAETTCVGCSEAARCRGGSIHLWSLGQRSPRFCYLHADPAARCES